MRPLMQRKFYAMSTAWIAITIALFAVLLANASIIIDHSCTDLTALTNTQITNAAQIKAVLRRASVGGNISAGLDDLTASDAKYNRSNWTFSDRGNPSWQAKVSDLITYTAANPGNKVYSMKFCYIDPSADWAVYRDTMNWLESNYPAYKFVW
jgi:hypothetical protein